MLTLWAYVRYTENLKSQISNFKFYYIAALLLFALGLMAKPMIVTLPFVLLLLDWWPLNRLRLDTAKEAKRGPPGTESTASLIVEKIPFILLAIPCAVLTLVAQHRGEAVASLSDLPFGLRMINAVVSYLRYLEKIVWPVDLSILYPFTVRWPAWEIVLAVVTLAAITALFVWGARPSRSHPSASRRRNASPYLLVGWLLFVGTLIPVIGLVQVGTQAMADRYAYIPSIGIFMVFCWGASPPG